jgi:hypothetical protein
MSEAILLLQVNQLSIAYRRRALAGTCRVGRLNADGSILISAALWLLLSGINKRQNLGILGCGMAILARSGRIPTSKEVPCSIWYRQSDPSAD